MGSSDERGVTTQWIEARVEYAAGPLHAELVADLFYDMGLHGVLLEGPDRAAGSVGLRATVGPHAVIGYIPFTADSGKRCARLRKRLQRLSFPTRLATRLIDDRDWAQYWKSHFKPMKIAPDLIIKPTWEKYRSREGEIVIEIDPGMAFGTGHHPTTILCLQLIRRHLKPGDTLLDVGTGTGILAICAVNSGSSRAVAVDSDQTAIAVANENRGRNRIAPDRLLLLCGDLTEPVKARFNVVVANILPHVVMELVDRLERVIEQGGIFIASGIPDEKSDTVIRKTRGRSIKIVEVQSRDGWTAFAGRYRL